MSWWDIIRDTLFRLSPYLPGVVGGLLLLGLLLTGILAVIWLKARRDRAADEGEDGTRAPIAGDPDYEAFNEGADDLPLLPMKRGFRHALSLLRSHVSGRDWRYAIPWYLLLGPENSGKSMLISHAGMDMPLGRPADDIEDLRPACKWWFFDRGVVLDVAGSLVRQRDGRGSNTRAWSRFLGYLDRYRPRRPADGVILTVPIEDLMDDDGVLRPLDDISARAEAIYRKLWQAQSRLGVAMPVYVVLTKMDRLPGFQTLVSELSEQALSDMLGWSSPYGFESEFREDWIDEAFGIVGARLQETQLSVFTTVATAEEAEEIFDLSPAFHALSEPLKVYLRQVFRPSVYHDGFSMRGVWFTGDSGFTEATSDRSLPILTGVYGGPRTRPAFPVFLRDLFDTKIFPERNMARPVGRALLSRNKTATILQASAAAVILLGGAVLWWKHDRMTHDVATVRPFIEEVIRDIRDVEATGRNTASNAGSFNRERALVLLEGMAALQTGTFFSLFIPSSWFGDADDRVVEVTTGAFNLFILQSMGAALDERGTAIAAGRLPPEAEATGTSGLLAGAQDLADIADPGGESAISLEVGGMQRLTRGPEYALLRRFVDSTRDFESAVSRYNQLSDSHDLQDVRRLVAYLFGVHLPETFLEDSAFYSRALSGSNYRPIPIDAYRRDMRARFATHLQMVERALYAEAPVLVRLQELADVFDQTSSSRLAGADHLDALRDKIAEVQELMGQPEFSWIDDPSFDPAIAYAPLTERIGGSRLLGAEQAADFANVHQNGLDTLQSILPDVRSFSVGPMLASEDGRAVLQLAEPVLDTYGVIQTMYRRNFMRGDRFQPLPSSADAGSAIEWDVRVLEEGLDLVADYDAFESDDLPRAPRALHPMFRTAGAERLERAVNDRIASAMVRPRGRATSGVQSEEALRRAVAAFDEASGPLSEIVATYDELGLEDSYLDLLDLTVGHAFSLIEEADSLFTAASLYVPQGGGFSWWDGDAGLALEAFRARDVFELQDVLAQQRGRVQIIASGYVKPLTEYLGSLEVRLSEREQSLLGKWQRIVEELTKYELQQADNTVAELERFITGPMMDVGFANCGSVLDDAQAQRRSSDFFLDRVSRLTRDIRAQCLQLAGVEAQTAYSAIADSFEDNLAGRYPFTLTPFEPDMREVTPRDLRTFFALYDRQVEGARLALDQATDLGFERDRALEFLTRMDGVRAFFDPWLSAATPEDSPVFDMAVSFRVNRAREVGAEQVIEWRMSSGSDTVSLRQNDGAVRWGLGEPIDLRFRWAENSNLIPAVASDRPQVRVEGRTVTVTYDNIWALIDLIRRHRAGSENFADFVDPRPHTLLFELPTRPEQGGTIEQARLFLRVELSAQLDGQEVPLVLTPFPYESERLQP